MRGMTTTEYQPPPPLPQGDYAPYGVAIIPCALSPESTTLHVRWDGNSVRLDLSVGQLPVATTSIWLTEDAVHQLARTFHYLSRGYVDR